ALGLPVAGGASTAATATLRRLDGRDVALFRLDGGKHRGAIGPPEGVAIERLVTLATELGVPIVGVLATSGADIHEGVASLHAWGRVARQVSRASGVVPIIFAVVGPCTSGPALMLGLADHVVMTPDSFAYVSGPEAVAEFTGVQIDRARLGGGPVHDTRTGVASAAGRWGSSPTSPRCGPAPSTSRRPARRPGSCSTATPSTWPSSPSSTRRGSSRGRTSSGGA